MDFLKDIVKTILGQNEQSDNQNLAESSKILPNDDQLLAELRHERAISEIDEPITKTNLQECYEESVIEREIIQCQRLHGRLLGSTSKKLRKRFGIYSHILGKYHCATVDRVINRFAKQRYRNNCPVKAQIKEEEKFPKSIIDHYFKTKFSSEFSTL